MDKYNFELQEKHAHIWFVNLKSLNHSSLLQEGFLSEEEKIKKARFATPWLKEKFLYSHAILRLLLAKYLNTSPSFIRYKYGMHQKPFIDVKKKQLAFNMSHANEWVAYGFSIENEIGVDIEEDNREISSLMELSELICNQEEKNKLNSIFCPEKRKMYFLHMWTAREAFLKMLGLGIGDFLPHIYFDKDWKAFLPNATSTDKKSYYLVGNIKHILNKGYIASIAVTTPMQFIACYELEDVMDLMGHQAGAGK